MGVGAPDATGTVVSTRWGSLSKFLLSTTSVSSPGVDMAATPGDTWQNLQKCWVITEEMGVAVAFGGQARVPRMAPPPQRMVWPQVSAVSRLVSCSKQYPFGLIWSPGQGEHIHSTNTIKGAFLQSADSGVGQQCPCKPRHPNGRGERQ